MYVARDLINDECFICAPARESLICIDKSLLGVLVDIQTFLFTGNTVFPFTRSVRFILLSLVGITFKQRNNDTERRRA